nr:cytochrome c oxidase subunit 3 [Amblyseius swirskii]
MPNKHSFHIVDISPWPLINSFNAMNLMYSMLMYFLYSNIKLNFLIINLMMIITTMFLWWRDIIRESSYQGHHTFNVYQSMKISMILFISSEIMFFLSFFWCYFYISLAPELEMGNTWPPTGISPMNPYQTPLLNTLILLTSGATISWTHYSILCKKHNKSIKKLSMTILLGVIFSLLQLMEYSLAEFCMNDSIFGSIFFMATGFHGIHVLIGTSFLTYNLHQLYTSQFSNTHHFSFEASAWYWHFVDVVWIYLYTFMYWWFY